MYERQLIFRPHKYQVTFERSFPNLQEGTLKSHTVPTSQNNCCRLQI